MAQQSGLVVRQNWRKLLTFAEVAGAVIAGGIFALTWSKGYFFSGSRIEDLNSFFASITLVALGSSTAAFQRMKGFTQYVPWIGKGVGILLLAGGLFLAKEFIRVASVLWF